MKNIFRIFTVASFIILDFVSIGAAHPVGDPWTAHYMWRRYYNTTAACDEGGTLAAYMCTGVILRGTTPAREKVHAWWPEDKSYSGISAGGVSFSYIRSDTSMKRMAYSYINGFTLYPQAGKYKAPDNMLKLQVLCAFPVDGGTDNRHDKGCGSSGQPYSDACQTYGINTGDQWVARYLSVYSVYSKVCGFNTTNNPKASFDAAVGAMVQIKNKTDGRNNELRIAVWDRGDDTSKKLPIESFFYQKGSSEGLKNAQNDQLDYLTMTGRFVPVIMLTLPTMTQDGNYDFHYNRSDQNSQIKIPTFPYPDPNPCTLHHFDEVC